mmetsp:Transcript_20931/g.53507  ORF Transcript_20931/g.53507 Transcript_20931/m.53507 type:complete len:495 (+) Transcript_20931:48-1532(+)
MMLPLIAISSLAADSVGTIVQLFEWRWSDVAIECCAYLGPRGYDAVQISPPMEQITASQWWSSYQPVSYNLGNRLGDESALAEMIETCKQCGVKVIADAVINHMAAGGGSGSSGSSFGQRNYPGTYSPNDFHHNDGDTSQNCVISNYQDRDNVQRCDLVGLPDLDSGADWPQQRIGAYLGSLGDMGVAGFRVDAAKHQAAQELGAILLANTSAASKEVYMEVIGAPGEAVQPAEYVPYGRVTEFGLSYAISDAVRSGQLSSLRSVTDGLLRSEDALAFIDNHDSQRSASVLASGHPLGLARRGYSLNATKIMASVLTYKDGELYAIANAFLLAFPYGRARLMSSYYFEDPDAGPPSQPVYAGGGGSQPACGTGQPWVCEHRWAAISGMVAWRTTAGSEALANWIEDGDGRIAFSRGAKAFIALAMPGEGTWSRTFQTGLPGGVYCDVAADAAGFGRLDAPCTAQVTISDDGQADLQVGSTGIHVIALHVGAREG